MDSIQINIQESNDSISVILQEDDSVVSVNILEQDTNINVSVAEFLSVAGDSSNTQLTQAQIEAMGFSTADNNTQLSDADIAALGYVKTDNDTQLSDADITALGYIKTYTDNNTQLSDADIAALGYVKTDNDTQLSDADITALGYVKTDNNTQLSDSDITALGYVKTDNNTQLSDADIAALGYVKTDTQLSDSDITALGYVKTDNNTQLSDADITALGYVKTDNDTQLSDSDIAALGYVKTDNDTQLSDADIAALGYVKTDNNTQLSDSDIAALGYVKTDNDTKSDWNATSGAAEILNKPTAVADLTNHYLKVSLPASHLTGGASRIDFDIAGDNLVSGLAQDNIAGTFISFANDKFTVSEDGMYTFNTSAEYQSLVTQRVTPAVYFKVNGVIVDGKSLAYIRQVGVVDEGTTNLSRTLILTAGDEVEVYYNNQGQINTGGVSTAQMFMVEAYSNSMSLIGGSGSGGGSGFTSVYTSNFFANASDPTNFYYMPFMGSSSEGTSIDQQKAIVCLHDGYVSTLQMMNLGVNTSSSTTLEFDIAKDTGTGSGIVTTSIYNSGTISHGGGFRFEARDTLSNTDATFSAGDILYIRYKSDAVLGRVGFTASLVYAP